MLKESLQSSYISFEDIQLDSFNHRSSLLSYLLHIEISFYHFLKHWDYGYWYVSLITNSSKNNNYLHLLLYYHGFVRDKLD